jgi:hypothetical protein
MKRIILPALLLLFCAAPSPGQFGYRGAERTVAQWYEQYLGRQMDPYAGSWVDALRSGQDPNQVLSGILGSDEYYRRTGGTPAGFVHHLYRDVTGRSPSPGEVRHWVNQVYYRPRAEIAYAILSRHGQDWDDRDRWMDRYDYRRPYSRYR